MIHHANEMVPLKRAKLARRHSLVQSESSREIVE
jgi:hypothetical protein